VLLHGWPQHWYLWRDVIPLVAPHARVIAPDFRGFGWSEVPEGGYEKAQLARDVIALLDELGVEEFTLAGHDWGGYVGFLLALEHPERVKSFLALGILPPWGPRNPRVTLESWRFLYQPVLGTPGVGRHAGRLLASRGLRDAGLSDAEVDAFVSRLDGDRGVATEKLYRSFVLRELPGIARGRYSPQDLSVPVELVLGGRDPVATGRVGQDLAAQSDQIELELVADADHFVVDEKPELVADRVLSLLSQ
jgi:pimeloyl-ACP methyl ester carboxylesterase